MLFYFVKRIFQHNKHIYFPFIDLVATMGHRIFRIVHCEWIIYMWNFICTRNSPQVQYFEEQLADTISAVFRRAASFVRRADISGRCMRNSNSLDILFFQECNWSTDFPLLRCFLMERTSREYEM